MAAKKGKKIAVYSWIFKSESGTTPEGKTKILEYVTQLNSDGTTSCDCPAWIFSRAPKACKHTNSKTVKLGLPSIQAKVTAGTPLTETSTEIMITGRSLEI